MSAKSLAERAMAAVLAKRARQAGEASSDIAVQETASHPSEAPDSQAGPSRFNTSRYDMVVPRGGALDFAPQKMLRLHAWPEMRSLPPEDLLPYANICALLAHGPSVGFLIHRRIGMAREQVMPRLMAMHRAGYLEVVHDEMAGLGRAGSGAVRSEPREMPPIPTRPSIWSRMMDKLLT